MGIFVGLGSNVGDREKHLRDASISLRRHGIGLLRSASLYMTEPRDMEDQPWFLNTVIEIETRHSPLELLDICLETEKEAGRVRDKSKGPRPLDLDILLFNDEKVLRDDLTLPHPRYADRRFVLVPLAEIVPDFYDPFRKRTIRQLLEKCTDQGEVRWYAPPLF